MAGFFSDGVKIISFRKKGEKNVHIIKEGPQLRLREGTAADIDYVAAVDGAPENAAFVTQDTREIREKNVASPDTKYLIVERRDTGEAVGAFLVAGLTNPDGEIEWRRIVITAKGKGYGREGMELLMAWSFDDLGFHRGWLDCKDYNDRALHLSESLGFTRDALLRETLRVGDHYENVVILAILDREYRARQKEKNLS